MISRQKEEHRGRQIGSYQKIDRKTDVLTDEQTDILGWPVNYDANNA